MLVVAAQLQGQVAKTQCLSIPTVVVSLDGECPPCDQGAVGIFYARAGHRWVTRSDTQITASGNLSAGIVQTAIAAQLQVTVGAQCPCGVVNLLCADGQRAPFDTLFGILRPTVIEALGDQAQFLSGT